MEGTFSLERKTEELNVVFWEVEARPVAFRLKELATLSLRTVLLKEGLAE